MICETVGFISYTYFIAVIKIGNVVWVLLSNKKFGTIHTILNKVTGFLLFLLPLTLEVIEPVYGFHFSRII